MRTAQRGRRALWGHGDALVVCAEAIQSISNTANYLHVGGCAKSEKIYRNLQFISIVRQQMNTMIYQTQSTGSFGFPKNTLYIIVRDSDSVQALDREVVFERT